MKILVYPIDNNPYQDFFYRNIKGNIETKYLYLISKSRTLGLFLLPFQLLLFRIRGFNIFHLHWINFLFPFSNNIFISFISFTYTIFCASFIKILGYKIVWTVHNLFPHQNETINDKFITLFILYLSNMVFVHSTSSKQAVEKIIGAKKNIVIIPMGSNIEKYKNTSISRNELLKKYNISRNSFVYLFFGKIRKYKGIEGLLRAFEEVISYSKKSVLILAGECNDIELLYLIQKFKSKYPNNTRLILRYIKDNEVGHLFKLSDVSVFPYIDITSSSSIPLSLSFGVPPIYPKIESLKDIPKNIGFGYDANHLAKIMKEVINQSKLIENKSIKAKKYISKITWSDISKIALVSYNKLF